MLDVHTYTGEDGEVLEKWDRIFSIPNTSSNSQSIDPFSESDYRKLTNDKDMTVGQMADLSAELSEKRKKISGRDPIKDANYQDYSDARKGKKYSSDDRPKDLIKEYKGRVKQQGK